MAQHEGHAEAKQFAHNNPVSQAPLEDDFHHKVALMQDDEQEGEGQTSAAISKDCDLCGRFNCYDVRKCRALKSSCGSCGEVGHWRKKCPNKAPSKYNKG